jgi:FtsH-binding integral membrane protein
MYSNPYSPPAAYGSPGQQVRWSSAPVYSPLGTRLVLASIALGFACFASFALDLAMLTFGEDMAKAEPTLESSLIVGGAGLVAVVGSLAAALFFCLWLHRAAKNLPALGRGGMQFTPGWSVGWFFIPFANLVKPLAAVSELWKASDPEQDPRDPHGWLGSTATGLLPMWWAAWIISSILGNISGRIDDSSTAGAIGLVGSVVSVVAAVLCVLVMRGISSRQDRAANRAASRTVAAP